jgi:hypothetical protein
MSKVSKSVLATPPTFGPNADGSVSASPPAGPFSRMSRAAMGLPVRRVDPVLRYERRKRQGH